MGILEGSLLTPIQDIYIYITSIYTLVFVPTISTDGHQKHYTLRIMGSQSNNPSARRGPTIFHQAA